MYQVNQWTPIRPQADGQHMQAEYKQFQLNNNKTITIQYYGKKQGNQKHIKSDTTFKP